MIVAITGGRDHKTTPAERQEFWRVFDGVGGRLLVHGDCRGVDREMAGWARLRKVDVDPYPVKAVDGDWPGAGPRRTRRMLKDSKAEMLIAFPGDKGTAWSIKIAGELDVPVYEIGRRP
jgi:hypothetical protein